MTLSRDSTGAELALALDGYVIRASSDVGDSLVSSKEARLRDAWIVLGAPIDIGSTAGGGARQGPSEIRSAFTYDLRGTNAGSYLFYEPEFMRLHDLRETLVLDAGDVWWSPGDSLPVFGKRLAWATRRILECGAVPVVLGGDHSITAFALEPVAQAAVPFGILHLDAHHDMTLGRPELSHANFMSHLLTHSSVTHVRQIGLRHPERISVSETRHDSVRISRISSLAAAERSAESLLEGLDPRLPWYLSIDIDVLDPRIAPETGTPCVGGLGLYKVLTLIDLASSRFSLIGVDIVEVSEGTGKRNAAASSAARLLLQLLLSRSTYKKTES